MIFLVRTDLKMGLGKIAAQVAHATLKAYKQMVARASQNDFDFIALEEWKEMGQKKIVVKVDGEAELLATIGKAKDKGINCCYIRDAGLTQVLFLFNEGCKWIYYCCSDWSSSKF